MTVEEEPKYDFQKAERFNSKTFQRFLKHLLTKHDKVSLIMDNISDHWAKSLDPFVEANNDRLWLYALPPYSPNLNAVEMVWRETRKDATHNRYFPTTKGLTRTVQTQFRTYQREPKLLAGIVAPFFIGQLPG